MSDDFFPFSDHDRRGKHRSEGDSHYRRSNHDHDDYDHHDSDRYRESRGHHGHDGFDLDRLKPIIERLIHNKTLMLLLAVGVLAVLAVCAVLVIAFYPVLVRIVDYVFGGGLKGVLELIQSVLGVLGAGEGK
jgi:hypothetical protein